MTHVDLTFQECHIETLRSWLVRPDRREAAAYVLCGQSHIGCDPWDRDARVRLTTHDVVPMPPEDLVSAGAQHVTWSTASYVRLLRRAKTDNLIPGIVHTHPDGPPDFSGQDDNNERDLMQLARNRNGEEAAVVSVLLHGADGVRARLWGGGKVPLPAVSVRSVGRSLTYFDDACPAANVDAFARQALVFGQDLNRRLRTLRVGIVGCGGTGSATAMLLARLGVGQMVLFDDDIVEVTNLNRLHGARRSDADAMRAKVDVVADAITGLALGTRVVALRAWVGNPACRDALKSCDVIFGCTDDHDGRLLLNRLAAFYLIPVLDMGLAIDPAPEGRGVRDLTGRVTVLAPGAPCLLCRGIVDPVAARDEDLRRNNPKDYERRKREAYVRGGGNPAPAVVTFTTATACLAVDELLQALSSFRGPEGWAWQRARRFDLMQDRKPGAMQDPHCPICATTECWGRGDIDPFLDRAG